MSAAPRASRASRRRRFWPIVGGLLIAAILGVGAFYVLTNFFSANGAWYGPMHVQSTPAVSFETYMDLSTNPIGGISGTGQFCLPNPFGGTFTLDVRISGQRDVQGNITLTAYYGVSGPFGLVLPVGPNLQMHGNVSGATFHLTGGNTNTPANLDMKHGTKADFITACTSLAPLGHRDAQT